MRGRPSTTSGAAAGTSFFPPIRPAAWTATTITTTVISGSDRGGGRGGRRREGDDPSTPLQPSLPCLMEKWITLRRDANAVVFRHRLRNLGTQPVSFVWNLHVAHAVGPTAAPPSRRTPGRSRRTTGGRTRSASCPWPLHADAAGARHDLSRVPGPETGITEFLFAHDLREGWCAVTHPSAALASNSPSDARFSRRSGSSASTVAGEATTPPDGAHEPPGSLADSVASGSAATLGPGEVLETEVVATVFAGVDARAPADHRPAMRPLEGQPS